MNPINFIITKQIFWAIKNDFSLMDSRGGSRGRQAYLEKIDNNFFQGLENEVKQSFENADGGELAGDVAKMQALHSSAALTVNIFKYWKDRNNLTDLLNKCKLCNKNTVINGCLNFESKFEIEKSFATPPNLDVVINNESSGNIDIYAIESKFSEPYYNGDNSRGLKEKYMALNVWDDIPKLKELAYEICPEDSKFELLHAAQLIKHILGLKLYRGKSKFRLLYLYYDVPDAVSAKHREEIEQFCEIAEDDNIKFHYLSYQKLIVDLALDFKEEHKDYIEYITDRYL